MKGRFVAVSCLLAFMVLNLQPAPLARTGEMWAGHTGVHVAAPDWPENSLPDAGGSSAAVMATINMRVVGQIGGESLAIDVEGNYAYIGVGPRLVILDCSDPVHPTFVGQSRVMRDLVRNVIVVGTYAYVNAGGLWVIDVSRPAAPREVGVYAVDTIADVAVSGSYAYLADSQAGLRVIDISNPGRLRQVGFCPTSRKADAVAVSGTYAYVLAGAKGLWVVDISNPSAPAQVGYCELSGNAYCVAAVGSYAYLGGRGCLWVIDASNPSAPQEVGCCPLQGFAAYIAIAGHYAYAVGVGISPFHGGSRGAALWILNISNPGSPGIVHFSDEWGDCYLGVVAVGPLLYLAAGSRGLKVMDVSGSWPNVLSSYQSLQWPSAVAVQGHYAYVADDLDGVWVIDISDISSPRHVGGLGGYSVGDVVVAGSSLYVWGYGGLTVWDISNPSAPQMVGAYGSSYAPFAAISGSYAYEATSGGIGVVDISDPASLRRVGSYGMGCVRDLAVSGSYAYVTNCAEEGFHILDVSDPTNIREVGHCSTLGESLAVAVSGSYAYVTTASSGFEVIDVSDPANPVRVGWCATSGVMDDVAVSGSGAYVMRRSQGGLYAIDISDPTDPEEKGFFYPYMFGTGRLGTDGKYAYVGYQYYGLLIVGFTPYHIYLPAIPPR